MSATTTIDVEQLLETRPLPAGAEVMHTCGGYDDIEVRFYLDLERAARRLELNIEAFRRIQGRQFDPTIVIHQIERLKLWAHIKELQAWFLNQIRKRFYYGLRGVWWQ